jgi:ribonuclease HIII
MDQGRVGVDESGKGDFFGPLVVAACYVGPEHLAELEESLSLQSSPTHAVEIQRTLR